MKYRILACLCLGWLALTSASAQTLIQPQFGRTFWATGYVRSVHHVLVFIFVTETIAGNSGGSKVTLGTSTEHTRLLSYLELAKKKGIRVRLHGFLTKNPPNVMAQLPTSPTIGFTVDKMHAPGEPDR
jgi:hypothetical protein